MPPRNVPELAGKSKGEQFKAQMWSSVLQLALFSSSSSFLLLSPTFILLSRLTFSGGSVTFILVIVPKVCVTQISTRSSLFQIISLLNVFTPQKSLEEFQDV